jgi:glutathione peroxidase
MANVSQLEVLSIDGQPKKLGEYAGRVLLIVNVASQCGLTPHYKGLEQLYRAQESAGLTVLGFPCNQFGGQEPGTEADIKSFCETKFDVTFPLFSKIEVNGPGRHPLYAALTGTETQPAGSGDVLWNFEKFVVDRKGEVVARFGPKTAPDDPALRAVIDRALAAPAA